MNYGNERISEPDAVDIVVTGVTGEFAGGLVATQKTVENRSFDSRAWHNLLWRRSALALWRRFDIAANKPASEPPRRDFLYGRDRSACQRSRDRRQVGFIGDTEMFKALPHTPGTGHRLPVELLRAEPSNQFLGALISGIEFGDQSNRPRRKGSTDLGSHRPKYTNTFMGHPRRPNISGGFRFVSGHGFSR